MSAKPSFWKQAWNWIQAHSLWLVAIGLMVASSGIDGTYIAKLNRWDWMGYVLNTVSDIANPALMYWYGRLQLDRSTKKVKKSSVVIWAEGVAIAYSWLFSWRQLRPLIYATETDPITLQFNAPTWVQYAEVEALAFVFAGFIPLLLAFIGYVQSLLAGRIENDASQEKDQGIAATAKAPYVQAQAEHRAYKCSICGASFEKGSEKAAHMRWEHPSGNGHTQPVQALEIAEVE